MHIRPVKPLLSKFVTIAFTFGRLTSRDRVGDRGASKAAMGDSEPHELSVEEGASVRGSDEEPRGGQNDETTPSDAFPQLVSVSVANARSAVMAGTK
jgi:hypothetical protein